LDLRSAGTTIAASSSATDAIILEPYEIAIRYSINLFTKVLPTSRVRTHSHHDSVFVDVDEKAGF
jgi:hypothetical protein